MTDDEIRELVLRYERRPDRDGPRWLHAPAYIIATLFWVVGVLAIMPIAAYLIGSLLFRR
jgi:hypothetical protein